MRGKSRTPMRREPTGSCIEGILAHFRLYSPGVSPGRRCSGVVVGTRNAQRVACCEPPGDPDADEQNDQADDTVRFEWAHLRLRSDRGITGLRPLLSAFLFHLLGYGNWNHSHGNGYVGR